MSVYPGSFPATRLRRLRQNAALRSLVAETLLQPQHLIQPLFVHDAGTDTPVASLPGVRRLCMESLLVMARQCVDAGLQAVALFPVIDAIHKTPQADEALLPDNLMNRAIRAVKQAVPELLVIGDVALDPYTSHGHDGVLDRHGRVDNDATTALLCQQALHMAASGCDILAPSDMMDGRIGAIRSALEKNSFQDTVLLSYAAKYASCFYGAFRDAVGSQQTLPLDKRSYQMNPANRTVALREVAMDIAEGADMVMVKPGLPYLDIISAVKQTHAVPVLAYQVSGEYAALHHGASAGAFDFTDAMLESLLGLRRAGADAILTYAALDIAQNL